MGTMGAKYWKNIRFLMRVSNQSHYYLRELISDIQSLLPRESRLPGSNPQKRAWIPVIGSGLKSIFGLATEEDLNKIGNAVNTMYTQGNQEFDAIKKQAKDLSSFATATNERLNLLVDQLKLLLRIKPRLGMR